MRVMGSAPGGRGSIRIVAVGNNGYQYGQLGCDGSQLSTSKGVIAMALSPQQRQRKIEKKRTKSKLKQRALARRASLGVAARLELVAAAPLLHCCVGETLWEDGLGYLVISRRLENGNVAFASFLLDLYCLGVKNAMGGFDPREVYDDFYKRFAEACELRSILPACARKLVEGAVSYAADLGFDPHPDYRRYQAIFGAIDPSQCSMTFEYGRDGRPHFVAGPNDTREKCARILNILDRRCGPGGYHWTAPAL